MNLVDPDNRSDKRLISIRSCNLKPKNIIIKKCNKALTNEIKIRSTQVSIPIVIFTNKHTSRDGNAEPRQGKTTSLIHRDVGVCATLLQNGQ